MRQTILTLLIALAISSCSTKESSTSLSPRFNHVFLNVLDIEESKSFYQKAFDVTIFDEIKKIRRTDAEGNSTESEVHIVLLRFANQGFNLEIGANPELVPANAQASYTHLGIDVADIEIASQRLLDAGAEPVRPITLVEANDIKAKTAFFLGPNGETLELMQVLEGSF